MNRDLQTKLALLQQMYEKKLPHKIDEIVRLWNELHLIWQKSTVKELHRQLHNLRGSSGSYGYDDLSQMCERLEKKVNQWILTKDTPTLLEIKEMDKLFLQLRDAAHH